MTLSLIGHGYSVSPPHPSFWDCGSIGGMSDLRTHRVLLISGPPGSGKTTLARPLAAELGFALLSKDDIKEALYAALGGPPGDLDFSRRMSAVAIGLLWALAPRCPAVVLEANFRTQSPEERSKLAALDADLLEIYCRVSREEASRRFAERARLERHHPAHPLLAMSPERIAECEEPFALSPVIEVDTSGPVDLPALLSRIRALWQA